MVAENELSQKDVTAVMNSVFNTIMDSLAAGFSIFSCKHRNEHQGRNPANGTTIDISASNAPRVQGLQGVQGQGQQKKALIPAHRFMLVGGILALPGIQAFPKHPFYGKLLTALH